MSISIDFCAVHSRNVSRSSKSPKNHKKPLLGHSRSTRSSKVIEFDGNRKPVYDFLLGINSNLNPEPKPAEAKIQIFPTSPSHVAPSFGATLSEFMDK